MAWAEHLFDEFRATCKSGKLPQVSWIVGPAGYTEHADWPVDYGAWYISQILDILVSNPEIFSKTVFIVNYDEADGSFDHSCRRHHRIRLLMECRPSVSKTRSSPPRHRKIPIGLGQRVPFLVISPWSKGGYVNSQVFDHTSVVQFLENRFGVYEANISPWRRAVAGDLTSMFNFSNPNDNPPTLPDTDGFLPPVAELAGGNVNPFIPSLGTVTIGVPQQEIGIRPARALPYELNTYAAVDVSEGTVVLTFVNSGDAAVVFQVRSGNPKDLVRTYTVQQGEQLSDTWNVASTYSLGLRPQWLRALLPWQHRLECGASQYSLEL